MLVIASDSEAIQSHLSLSRILRGAPNGAHLALQLSFMEVSESMGNHDSEIVDASSVD
jgi:hypothetical protein